MPIWVLSLKGAELEREDIACIHWPSKFNMKSGILPLIYICTLVEITLKICRILANYWINFQWFVSVLLVPYLILLLLQSRLQVKQVSTGDKRHHYKGLNYFLCSSLDPYNLKISIPSAVCCICGIILSTIDTKGYIARHCFEIVAVGWIYYSRTLFNYLSPTHRFL